MAVQNLKLGDLVFSRFGTVDKFQTNRSHQQQYSVDSIYSADGKALQPPEHIDWVSDPDGIHKFFVIGNETISCSQTKYTANSNQPS